MHRELEQIVQAVNKGSGTVKAVGMVHRSE